MPLMHPGDIYPITMRHQRRGARWAIARFADGDFALYRYEGGIWRSRVAPAVRIVIGEVIPV